MQDCQSKLRTPSTFLNDRNLPKSCFQKQACDIKLKIKFNITHNKHKVGFGWKSFEDDCIQKMELIATWKFRVTWKIYSKLGLV